MTNDVLLFLRFRLLLSDGQFSYCNCSCLVVTQLNPMIQSNQLAPFTIIKVKEYLLLSVKFKLAKNVLILKEFEVVTHGNQIGVKVGDPTSIDPDPVEAKLTALR